MSWIKFSSKKPTLGEYLITRSPTAEKGVSCFEDWTTWRGGEQTFRPYRISHWWDGEDNFKMAIEAWENEKDKNE